MLKFEHKLQGQIGGQTHDSLTGVHIYKGEFHLLFLPGYL